MELKEGKMLVRGLSKWCNASCISFTTHTHTHHINKSKHSILSCGIARKLIADYWLKKIRKHQGMLVCMHMCVLYVCMCLCVCDRLRKLYYSDYKHVALFLKGHSFFSPHSTAALLTTHLHLPAFSLHSATFNQHLRIRETDARLNALFQKSHSSFSIKCTLSPQLKLCSVLAICLLENEMDANISKANQTNVGRTGLMGCCSMLSVKGIVQYFLA